MEKHIQYSTAQIQYLVKGKGETVVLLHGYLETSEIWGQFADELSENYQVILIDLPGHGKSSFVEGQNMNEMAKAVHAVFEAEAIEQAHLVGHSMGGYVSLAFLELFPTRLNSICLFHSHPFADAPAAFDKRNREIELVRAGKKDLLAEANIPNGFANDNLQVLAQEIEQVKNMAKSQDGDGVIACLQSMRDRKDRSELWASTEIPTLLISGAKDNYIPATVLKKIDMPKNGKHFQLMNSGHQGFIEEPIESEEILVRFFESIHR